MVDGVQIKEKWGPLLLAKELGLEKYPWFSTEKEALAWSKSEHALIDEQGQWRRVSLDDRLEQSRALREAPGPVGLQGSVDDAVLGWLPPLSDEVLDAPVSISQLNPGKIPVTQGTRKGALGEQKNFQFTGIPGIDDDTSGILMAGIDTEGDQHRQTFAHEMAHHMEFTGKVRGGKRTRAIWGSAVAPFDTTPEQKEYIAQLRGNVIDPELKGEHQFLKSLLIGSEIIDKNPRHGVAYARGAMAGFVAKFGRAPDNYEDAMKAFELARDVSQKGGHWTSVGAYEMLKRSDWGWRVILTMQ
jgi:hypothetical protein